MYTDPNPLNLAADLPSKDAEAVHQALNRVLKSTEFRGSRRCQEFLCYVVEQTLASQGESLKERTIGIDAFGLGADYDPSGNATVRVRAMEVRKRLEQYYVHEGAQDPLRISIPTGSYVPLFLRNVQESGVMDVSLQPPVRGGLWQHHLGPGWLRVAASLLLLVTAAGIVDFVLHRQRQFAATSALADFWSPLIHNPMPTLLVGSALPIYSLNHNPVSPTPVQVSEFVLIRDQYMAVSDIKAIDQVSAYLGQKRHPYEIQIGPPWSFDQLRGRPAVLVGYTYTYWKDISSDLRYFIHVNGPPFGVLDRGQKTAWVLSTLPNDPKLSEDFGLVSRVFDPDTHAMLVEISGISHYGTAAAANLITDPSLFAEAIRGAPSDWKDRDLQIIIHVRNIAGSASAPRVVAAYFGQPLNQPTPSSSPTPVSSITNR